MTQYILKDVIVAEIKELIRANELCLSDPETDEVTFQIKTNIYNVLNDLLHFIDTLEVKEVDLEKEIDNYIQQLEIWEIQEAPLTSMENIAKHFFELGLKAQKGK